MRILISNDDGFNSYGIKLLEKLARDITDDVWVVAPEQDQSGASHSLTLSQPLRIREVGHQKFAINGTPTDCVMIALKHILKGLDVDLVLSGINSGSNLASDITYSGTIAAALEGAIMGVKSTAISMCGKPNEPYYWDTAEKYLSNILQEILAIDLSPDVYLNINIPPVQPEKVTGVKITSQALITNDEGLVERVDPRGKSYYWIGGVNYNKNPEVGTDLHAINSGAISITPLSLDLTHDDTLSILKKAFLP